MVILLKSKKKLLFMTEKVFLQIYSTYEDRFFIKIKKTNHKIFF
jgi:hypothetical protein